VTDKHASRARRLVLWSALVAAATALSSCGWFPYYAGRDTYSPASSVFYNDLDGVNPDRAIHYDLSIGDTPKDVYIVFTNPTAATVTAPVVANRSHATESGAARGLSSRSAGSALADRPIALPDHPGLFGWEPPEPGVPGTRATGTEITPPPHPDETVPDDIAEFYVYRAQAIDGGPTVTAELILERSVDGKNLEVWVEGSQVLSNTGDRVTALADRFMSSGANDDIYDWVSTVYGREWSPEAGGTSTDAWLDYQDYDSTITILLYDIEDSVEGNGAGGIIGLFSPYNNYTADYLESAATDAYTNERIMFYLDSETFNEGEDGWDIDDYWPSEIVSTLAHELQHMIHFHERWVLAGASTPVWLNETMSLAAEDLVEQKRNRPGPRGVDPTEHPDGGAGPDGNQNGRLPRYNLRNDLSLTSWPNQTASADDLLNSYSMAYAFGAFLGREFGGAQVFRSLAESDSPFTETMLSEATGYGLEELLWRWGAAVLLSGDSGPNEYELNTGSWIDSSVESATYRLGSIDHYTYEPEPYVHTDLGFVTSMPGASKLLYRVGTGLTGDLSLELQLSEGTDFTVVVR
jgi:hypothetical protein